jgi:hypothetical protein
LVGGDGVLLGLGDLTGLLGERHLLQDPACSGSRGLEVGPVGMIGGGGGRHGTSVSATGSPVLLPADRSARGRS